ncbi:cytidine deaminase [Pontibacter ummariensis]|uniref:Cytidine deaminase n=1 Tax=Pontibacter ummariensis TaxID=1610492 RepID=A0A239EG20_9BACT|nr:cytidine deaminase [Pontibacter ummariensis]PRY13225.1 cytidine deaminase [Pontibacter ummariensis]SNS43198.1 cytidine deaminase [Pontibacter ummariensis]
MASELNINISIDVLDQTELSDQEREAMQLAQEAANDAYAPYSNFLVGAALVLEDGSMFKGSNQENAAYPSGLCAERTALFAMSAHYPNKKIKMMAVTARRRSEETYLPAMPCGACRQVMAEYEHKQQENIPVLLQTADGKFYRFRKVADLLPFLFTKDNL